MVFTLRAHLLCLSMLNTAYHFLVLIRFFLQYQLSWDLFDVTAIADTVYFLETF